MRIPLHINCPQCKTGQFVWIYLHDDSITYVCINSACQNEHSAGFNIDAMRLGWRMMLRSQYELTETKDYSLAIVMAAGAVEIDLTRLYIKWTGINELDKGKDYDQNFIENEFKKCKQIIEKITKTGHLLNPQGFDEYVRQSEKYNKIIFSGFSNIDLNHPSKSFIEELFWPRNEILHRGKKTYSDKEAIICYNTARLWLQILWDMDLERRKHV